MNINGVKLRLALLLAIFPILILLAGCAKEDVIDVPLQAGRVFVFSGKYTSTGAAGKKISMQAHPHRIVIEREFEIEGEKRYQVVFYIGDQAEFAFILTKNDQGLFHVMGRKKKTLLIPSHVKSGQTWKFQGGDQEVTGKAGGWKVLKSPYGTKEGREISLSTPRKTRIKLLFNNNTGPVALRYSYIMEGAGRSEADLYLEKVMDKEETEGSEGGKK